MESLIKQAEQLMEDIRRKKNDIDNPALYRGILSELQFFIDNAEGEEE